MKKKKKIYGCILFASVFLSLVYMSPWFMVKYVPVISIFCAEPFYEQFPELSRDEIFIDAAENIFKKYNERYFRLGNTIYIQRQLARDTDLLANYTRKALGDCGHDIPESKTGIKSYRGGVDGG